VGVVIVSEIIDLKRLHDDNDFLVFSSLYNGSQASCVWCLVGLWFSNRGLCRIIDSQVTQRSQIALEYCFVFSPISKAYSKSTNSTTRDIPT
jgi:hypothetical protein